MFFPITETLLAALMETPRNVSVVILNPAKVTMKTSYDKDAIYSTSHHETALSPAETMWFRGVNVAIFFYQTEYWIFDESISLNSLDSSNGWSSTPEPVYNSVPDTSCRLQKLADAHWSGPIVSLVS